MTKGKKIITCIFSLLLLLFFTQERTYAEELEEERELIVTEENVPDPNFRDYIKTLPGGEDLYFTHDELEKITVIACSGDGKSNKKIKSLKGIELFTYLTYLDVENQLLTELDLSQNKAIEEVYCKNNKLNKLTITSEHLSNLDCSNNQLTSLEINSDRLAWIECNHNKLTSLSLDSSVLFDIDCSNNQLSELYLPSTKLTRVVCANNHLTSLAFDSENVEIIEAYNNDLETLDVLNYPKLVALNLNANYIEQVDTSKNELLKNVYYAPKDVKMNTKKNFDLKNVPTLLDYITVNAEDIKVKGENLNYNKEQQTVSLAGNENHGKLIIEFTNKERGSYSYLFYYGKHPNDSNMMSTFGVSIIVVSVMILVGVFAVLIHRQKH